MKHLLTLLSFLAGWLISILLMPLLMIVYLQWREHERLMLLGVFCDGHGIGEE